MTQIHISQKGETVIISPSHILKCKQIFRNKKLCTIYYFDYKKISNNVYILGLCYMDIILRSKILGYKNTA